MMVALGSTGRPDAEVLRYTASLYFMRGQFDLSTDDLLRQALTEWGRDGGPLTIDMSQVTFIDSTAVHALLSALKRPPSGCLILHGVYGAVARALHVMGVDRMTAVHVNECGDRDPYPTGRALLGPDGSRDVIVRLNALRDSFARSRASSEGITRRTDALLTLAAQTHARIRERRLAA